MAPSLVDSEDVVASWSAYVYSSHLKRNARASMVIGNGLDFPEKWSLMGK
jgi:hypothetical protein